MNFNTIRFVAGRSRAGRLVAIAGVAGAMSLVAGNAFAAGLLDALPDTEAASVEGAPPSPFASRDRLMRLDYGYMESNVAPRGMDRARDRIRKAPASRRIDIDLFPDLSVTLDRTSLRKADLGGYEWLGNVRGEDGYALLIVSDDQITGQIQIGARVFTISPVAGGVHRVSEIDPASFPPEESVPAPAPAAPVAAPDPGANPEARTTIRVLIPYSRKAKAQSGNIGQTAKKAIALANLAARKSGVLIRYRLAGTVLVRKYRERSFDADLDKVTGGKGPFRGIPALRNRRKADLVAVLRKDDALYCGLGWYIAAPSNSTSGYGFTVTAQGCVTNHSMTHEMGHNSGLEHDRYQLIHGEGRSNPPNTDYNFGYTNVGTEIVSIMAYQTECNANGKFCARVPMFSTPLRTYQGSKIGVGAPSASAADSARRLNETRAGVASYR